MVMFVEPALWIQCVVSGKKHAQNSGCPEIIKGPSLTVWREKVKEKKLKERVRRPGKTTRRLSKGMQRSNGNEGKSIYETLTKKE